MTKEQFSEGIELLIRERERKLTKIEKIIFIGIYEFTEEDKNILALQTIPMIYSLWESFVQDAFKIYIEYLNSLRIELVNFSDNIYLFDTLNKFKQFKEFPIQDKKRIIFLRGLDTHFKESVQNLFGTLDTESNVKFHVLNKLLNTFDLEQFQERWGSYTHPNPTLKSKLNELVNKRNDIAHGQGFRDENIIEQDDYSGYKQLILDLMAEIHIRMLDGIENETYKK